MTEEVEGKMHQGGDHLLTVENDLAATGMASRNFGKKISKSFYRKKSPKKVFNF